MFWFTITFCGWNGRRALVVNVQATDRNAAERKAREANPGWFAITSAEKIAQVEDEAIAA